MRTLIPSRTVALHERLNEASLPHLCTIEVFEGTDDGEGGWVGDWTPDGDPIPCRVSPLGTAVERVQAEQTQADARYVVVFARGVVVPLAARLTIEIGEETLILDPHGSNGPRSFEAQRKYECSLWGPANLPVDEDYGEEDEEEQEL